MIYKISDICSELAIGKSTIYKRIDVLKKDIPDLNCENNEYFYYSENRKLFITEKGFDFIKNYKNNNIRQNSTNNLSALYQNQIIDLYKQRIEYLENENKRLLDIISFKEQKELANNVKNLNSVDTNSFFSKIFRKFMSK